MIHINQTAVLAFHDPESVRQSWLLKNRNIQFGFEPANLKGRDRRHPCCTQDRTRTEPSNGGPRARDSVTRMTCTWTGPAMTDAYLASSKGHWRGLTRTETGAIFAPHETQQLVVSDEAGVCSSVWSEKSKCAC